MFWVRDSVDREWGVHDRKYTRHDTEERLRIGFSLA